MYCFTQELGCWAKSSCKMQWLFCKIENKVSVKICFNFPEKKMSKILFQCLWSDNPSFTEELNTTSCIQRLVLEVLCLVVVFPWDFCTLVFNRTLMFSPHERKIYTHYIFGWAASAWQLQDSYGGFFSAFNLSPLEFHSPTSRLILCTCCSLNRLCFFFNTVIFFMSKPSCMLNDASESLFFSPDYSKLCVGSGLVVCVVEREAGVRYKSLCECEQGFSYPWSNISTSFYLSF